MSIGKALKLTIPAAFFGYAAFANYSLLTSDVEGPKWAGLWSGEVTQEIDTIYRANLPHRDPAVGIKHRRGNSDGASDDLAGRNTAAVAPNDVELRHQPC